MQEYSNIPRHLPSVTSTGWAVCLDLDGTLIDIAETPDAVIVPDALIALLDGLRTDFSGAIGILSGRPLNSIDALLHPLRLPAAGEHGAMLRLPDGAIAAAGAETRVPEEWRARIRQITSDWRGLLIEEKAHGLALHYRANPMLAGPVAELLEMITAEDTAFQMLPARMARELRHVTINKGIALKRLMEVAPFRGRRPLFIGDDATDMDAIAAANRMGGIGLLVGDCFAGSVANVRDWLASLLRRDARRATDSFEGRGR